MGIGGGVGSLGWPPSKPGSSPVSNHRPLKMVGWKDMHSSKILM